MGNAIRKDRWHGSVAQWFLGAEGQYQQVLRQVPLVMVTALVTVIMAIFFPRLLSDPLFLMGLAVLAFSVALSVVLPWRKLPATALLLPPVLDLVAIGVSRSGAAGQVDVFGLLVVFPTIWLAMVDKHRGAWIAMAGMAAIIVIPIAFTGAELSPQAWSKLIILPVTMGAVGLTVSVITQRLETSAAENRHQHEVLHSILQAIDVDVIALDVNGNTVASNDDELAARARIAAEAASGTDSSAAALAAMDDTPIFEADRKTPIPFSRRPLVRAARGEHFSNYLFWDQHAGSAMARYATAGPVHNGDGEVVGSVLAFSDVTPLMKATAAQSTFAAAISHELRTPLAAILGYSELMRERLEDDGDAPAPELAVIERGTHRLLLIVEDLLTAASAEMSMAPIRLEMADAVHSAIMSMQPVADAAGIGIEHHTSGSTPVLVDPVRIGQLLDNLLSNAVKYSGPGTTIHVTTGLDAEAGQVLVAIEDQGPGISAEDLELVFDHFYRGTSARQSGIPGTGLGLSMVKALAERHNGSVRLASTVGEGTTAELRLPAAAQSPRR